MFRIRHRFNSWTERCVLAAGMLRGGPAVWSECERLVFVCSGNICRSPYGEVLARARGLSAISCGTHTDNGLTANARAIEVAGSRGVDLSAHRTQRWQDLNTGPGDVIIALQLRHARAVLPRARRARSPVVILSALLPDFETAHDPYGQPAEEFVRVFDLIDAGVSGIQARLNGGQANA
jgi:protein-tyrosine phosphatase